MLSGEFETVSITSIWVNRGERIRKVITPEAVAEKAESIRRIGLIHPLVIRRDGSLVSGETRWEALKFLGWDAVPIQWSDTLDERELLSIELEENIKRTDLTWQDQCNAMLRYHKLQTEMHDEWSYDQTADAIGVSRTTVADYLAVGKELEAKNPRVLDQKEYTVARGIVKRQTERKKQDDISLLKINLSDDDEEEEAVDETVVPASPILVADFNEWVEAYDGPSFNLIHCDFPYGIGADSFNQGAADAFGGYEDSPETYWKLVANLVKHRDKLLGTSGHIIFWFSMQWYTETLAALSEHFWVDPYPLVWHKSDNKGTLPDPQRGPRRVYEVAFLCSHGDRKIIQSVSNTFSGPTTRISEHMSEKSQAMLQHFMRMVVDENTRMLDPTCGGGSALRAAAALGAGSVLGLEKNEEFAENARRTWEKIHG